MIEELDWADIFGPGDIGQESTELAGFDDSNIEALRGLVLRNHSLDVRITPNSLFQTNDFLPELAEIADELSLYIYTYDGRSNTPTLWVLQDLEYTYPDIVSASLVNFDISPDGTHYVRSKVIGRVDIWATDNGLETTIEGVRQVFLPNWMEMDAFVVEHGKSLVDIRTDVILSTGLAITDYRSISPRKPSSNPNTNNPSHHAEGNEPVAGVDGDEPRASFAPADHAELASEGEAEPEPEGKLESAA